MTDMQKIIITADFHIGDTTPPSRVDDYKTVILNKIKFIIDYAEENNVDFILIAGDIFHIKAPSRNSHSLIRELISLFKNSKAQVISVIGNHDWYKSPSYIEKQPISVLEESGAIKLLKDGESFSSYKGTFHLAFYGLTSTEERDSNPEAWNVERGKEDFAILLSHQMLLKDNDTFFGRYINFKHVNSVTDVDMVITGHYHPGYNPPVQEAYDKYWVNPGAIARIATDDHNFYRIPSFVVGTITANKKFKWNTIVIPSKEATEIFDKRSIKKRKDAKSLDELVERIAKVQEFDTTSSPSIISALGSLTDDEEVLRIARDLLDEAETLL